MPATKLGLYELLAPQFLLGFTFPDYIDQYLAFLGVDELHQASDESGVVFTGKLSFGGAAGATPVRQHRDPSGAIYDWEDVILDFRLTLPRDGAAPIHTAVTNTLPELDSLFNRFGAVEQTLTLPTEYPGVRFRLELMLTALTFHLGKEWKPGMLDPVAHTLILSNDPEVQGQDVRFLLPKVVLQYEQGDDLSTPPAFSLNSWGSAGFDAPHDLAEGELVRMVPPISIHESGRFGFGVDQILLDLSSDHTPSEILQFFGTDDSFKGLYIKSLRFYYNDRNKDLGINIAVNDGLISFTGQVSLEASLDLFTNIPLSGGLHVDIKFYNGSQNLTTQRFTQGRATDSNHPLILTGGSATIPNTATVQVHINGGCPAYTVHVKLEDGTELWDSGRNEARISPGMPGTLRLPNTHTLVVSVEDQAAPNHNLYSHTINLTLEAAQAALTNAQQDGSDRERPPQLGDRQTATFVINPADQPLPPGYEIQFTPSTSGTAENLIIQGGTTAQVRVMNGANLLVNTTVSGPSNMSSTSRVVNEDVPDGASYDVTIDYQASTEVSETFTLQFDLDKPFHPNSPNTPRWPAARSLYLSNNPASTGDTQFQSSGGAPALNDWIQNRVYGATPNDKHLTVDGYASFELDHLAQHDQELSDYRRQIAEGIIGSQGTVTGSSAHGHDAAISSANPSDRMVTIIGVTSPAAPAKTVHGTLARPARLAPTPPPSTPVVDSPPIPPALPDHRPTVVRRLSFRVRLERNIPVLLEFSGELDFDTEMEQRLRAESASKGIPVSDADSHLQMQQRPGASTNPNNQDGVVDFKINVTYDTSTKQLTETLTLGAAPGDLDGLLRMDNPRTEGSPASATNRFKNIFGSLLTFAPIINSVIAAADSGSAGDWAVVGISLAVPVAIGGLDIFRTKAVTLYGGEMKFRQFLPSGSDPLRFTDAGIIFDYGVEFGITVDLLHINTTKPLKVRYKAVGFNLHFENGVTYQPIFDTSKGYEIDLNDPGLFNMPSPLGDILKILAVRIARFNPLTLELDFGLKVDLGVVTVDRFKVKMPLDPPGLPMILPTGASVNIPSTLVGSGFVNIIQTEENGIKKSGFEGGLDLTLVPVKIRIAASIGVETLEDANLHRKVIAIYFGLVVEFPTPIVLFSTGLGIYGFNGLFAMHYKRVEVTRAAGDSVSPALRWLITAEGEPSHLKNSGHLKLWDTDFDRWSFGIGLILGTLDTGFTLNLRGTFVLELPGPRILIFIKVLFIAKLPDLKPATDLTVGILGVVDLDFNLGQLTIGIMVDLTIKDLISLQLPIEVFFKFKDLSQWHFYIGTIAQPASALILNIVRARGYFMATGDKIDNFPKGDGTTMTLPGVALATGIQASIVFGSESAGLYLKVAAAANLGVSFSPKLYIVGNISLEGELHLWILSIEAHGLLTAEAPDPTIVHGEICGKVHLFFFSVEGCVGFTIGSGTRVLPAPALVRSVYVQSHSPVLTAGQGTDRPIDASLGDAVQLVAGNLPPNPKVPILPIDSVPVIQMQASPRLAPPTTFTQSLNTPPGLAVPDGWINVGGGRQVRYLLQEISLDPPLVLPNGVGTPPATWRTEHAPGPIGVNTNIDLALLSRVPITGERALERSSDLNAQITTHWSGLCKPVAPPACVLWTFCGQSLGPSGSGWHLTGVPQLDPPGTTRTALAPITMYVEEPASKASLELVNLLAAEASQPFEVPGRVIGLNPGGSGSNGLGKQTRVDFRRQKPGQLPNPLKVNGIGFLVNDYAGNPFKVANLKDFNGTTMLDTGHALEIVLPHLSNHVEVTLVSFSYPAVLEALDSTGSVIATGSMSGRQNAPEILTLTARGIASLNIITKADETLLVSVGYAPQERTTKLPEKLECWRALQLPYLLRRRVPSSIKVDERLKKFSEELASQQWIRLHTGAASQVTVFMAVARLLRRQVYIRQLDAGGAVLSETELAALGPVTVTGTFNHLPNDWLNPALSWRSQVLPAASFLARPGFRGLSRLLFTLKPDPNCVTVEIRVSGNTTVLPPQVLIATVEVCSLAEEQRVFTETSIQTGQIKTLTGYLNGSDPVALLQPGTTYTLSIRYDADSKADDGTINSETNLVEQYQFKTDCKPPARLDPYVLATSPNHEEKFVFYEDEMRVVFNDLAVVQLYMAYGKQLRAVLRAADGLAIPAYEITSLDPIPAVVDTPYHGVLTKMVAEGQLPCMGEVTNLKHGDAILPFPLRPMMGYTLDIELDPADQAPIPPIAITPLFRRAFTTGKYASLGDLASSLGGCSLRHRLLNSQINSLTANTATDQAIQTALLGAGEQALPAASGPSITIYWAKRAGESHYSPHVIMLDTEEPLWRLRSEPIVETVPDQDDPAFKRIVPKDVFALEVIEQGNTVVDHFVHSPGGTRTLAFIKNSFTPPPAGTGLTLAAHRPPSNLYNVNDLSAVLVVIPLTAHAPWEDDHV